MKLRVRPFTAHEIYRTQRKLYTYTLLSVYMGRNLSADRLFRPRGPTYRPARIHIPINIAEFANGVIKWGDSIHTAGTANRSVKKLINELIRAIRPATEFATAAPILDNSGNNNQAKAYYIKSEH